MHQGAFLHQIIKKSGYPLTAIARKLQISRTLLYKKLKEPIVDKSLMLAVGSIIQHDFPLFFPDIEEVPQEAQEKIEAVQKETRKLEKQYLKILEAYIDLVFLTIKAMGMVKKPIVREEIAHFIAKRHRLSSVAKCRKKSMR